MSIKDIIILLFILIQAGLGLFLIGLFLVNAWFRLRTLVTTTEIEERR